MAGEWIVSNGLRKWGEKVFANYADKLDPDLDIEKVNFVFLKYSKTRWLGRCYVVPYPYRCFADCDFIIALNYHMLKGERSKKQFRRIVLIVLLHELTHIIAAKRRLKKHDTEDFGYILEKFGIHWPNKSNLPNILKRKK